MGGSVLGEGQWVWGVHEVQETDQCTEIWFESDSQQKIHTLVVTDYQQSERKPYIYCFVRTSFTYCRMVYYKLSSSLLRKPFSGFCRMKQGVCPGFFDRGKVQTWTERTKSVCCCCCCCCWVSFPHSKLFLNQTYPYLYSGFQVRCCWFLICDLAVSRLFFLLKTHKSGHCGVTRSIATPPVLMIISRRWPSFPDIKLVPSHTPGWR